MLSSEARAFDVGLHLMLYGDKGRGLRTHAHAEAVIEIRAVDSDKGRDASRNGAVDASILVVKIGFFLDLFSVRATRGRRVTSSWPTPGYTEPGYRGANVRLASLGLTGWSRDLVEDALRRTVNLASHPFTQGYAKIPNPGEYNCFAYALSVISIWLGGSLPLWGLGSVRAFWCIATTAGVGIEVWLSSVMMMLLQLPLPLNYAFGQLFLIADRGSKAGRRELLPCAVGVSESVFFVATCLWLLSMVLYSNNFWLILGIGLLLVTPIHTPWRMC
jgi:hypothetical protein